MTASLFFYGALGVASTVVAFAGNRHLFTGGAVGRPSPLEGLYYLIGVCSLVLGWYFDVRYTHQYGHRATYANYTKMLFSSWAADSAAQDYAIVNVVLLPLWTIIDGRRRGLRVAWIFFVMSLFTSLAFSVAMFLAFIERQLRYNRAEATSSSTA
jgi:Terpene cyclase DEP1